MIKKFVTLTKEEQQRQNEISTQITEIYEQIPIGSENEHINELKKAFELMRESRQIKIDAERRYINSIKNDIEKIYKNIDIILKSITTDAFKQATKTAREPVIQRINDYKERQKYLTGEMLKKAQEQEKSFERLKLELVSYNFISYYNFLLEHTINELRALTESNFDVVPYKKRLIKKAEEYRKKPSSLKIEELKPETETFSVEEQEKIQAVIDSNNFELIRQGRETNLFAGVHLPKAKEKFYIDTVSDIIEYKQEGITISLANNPNRKKGLTTSTHQLLDALICKATQTGLQSPIVTLPIKEYMEKRNLTNYKEARAQIIDDLDILSSIRICINPSGKRTGAPYTDLKIIGTNSIRNGVAYAYFDVGFMQVLKHSSLMPYPLLLWALDNNKNPNSYNLFRCILVHKQTNKGKPNQNIISVRTLLKHAPKIPAKDEVKNRHISDRIIEPFERDMDALSPALSWHYCHKNDVPISDAEAAEMNYQTFIDLLIKITWK